MQHIKGFPGETLAWKGGKVKEYDPFSFRIVMGFPQQAFTRYIDLELKGEKIETVQEKGSISRLLSVFYLGTEKRESCQHTHRASLFL